MWRLVILVTCVLGAQPGGAQSNEGIRFAFTLPPVYEAVSAELIIHSREDTRVLISFPLAINDRLDVEANTPVHYLLNSALRCIEGIEDKGVIVIALDAPISLHLSNYEYTTARNPDSTILRPIPDSNVTDDIFLAGYNNGSTSSSSSYRPKSYYMVVGTEEDTEVEVYRKQGNSHVLSQQFTLGLHDVFTEDAYYHSPDNGWVDFTGSFVRATKPVAVYSGHGCARLPVETVSDSYSRSLFESMPYFNDLGYTYVTTPYHFGAKDIGYKVRVISVVDDTTVFVPATAYNGVLDAGSFYHFDFPVSRLGTPINCSHPCMVVQYAKKAEPGDSPGGRHLNEFMLVLTPKDHYSNDAHFSTNTLGDNSNTLNALSLVVDFYPVDDLYLDGVNLDYLDWMMATGNTGYFATVSIEHGYHELYTTDPEHRFAAYYHASYHTSSSSQMSYGYAVSYGVASDGNSTEVY